MALDQNSKFFLGFTQVFLVFHQDISVSPKLIIKIFKFSLSFLPRFQLFLRLSSDLVQVTNKFSNFLKFSGNFLVFSNFSISVLSFPQDFVFSRSFSQILQRFAPGCQWSWFSLDFTLIFLVFSQGLRLKIFKYSLNISVFSIKIYQFPKVFQRLVAGII